MQKHEIFFFGKALANRVERIKYLVINVINGLKINQSIKLHET